MYKVLSINISDRKKVQKNAIKQGEFIYNHGLKGDAHAGEWHRQVSFLPNESIEKMKSFGLNDLGYGDFAENITTEGIKLNELKIGTVLEIGKAVFEVTQIGKKCHDKCEIFKKVGSCVMPKDGIFAKVLNSGIVAPGDEIKILPKDLR